MKNLIQKACDLVGGQTALARALSKITGRRITQQRVNTWIVRGDEVPVDLMAAIEEATAGFVSRKDFRPGDWQTIWPELVRCAPKYKPVKGERRAEERRKSERRQSARRDEDEN